MTPLNGHHLMLTIQDGAHLSYYVIGCTVAILINNRYDFKCVDEPKVLEVTIFM